MKSKALSVLSGWLRKAPEYGFHLCLTLKLAWKLGWSKSNCVCPLVGHHTFRVGLCEKQTSFASLWERAVSLIMVYITLIHSTGSASCSETQESCFCLMLFIKKCRELSTAFFHLAILYTFTPYVTLQLQFPTGKILFLLGVTQPYRELRAFWWEHFLGLLCTDNFLG